jgi:hypothetical protein
MAVVESIPPLDKTIALFFRITALFLSPSCPIEVSTRGRLSTPLVWDG